MQPALPPLCLNPTGFPPISDGKLSSAKSLRKQQTVLSYLPSFDVAIDLGQHNADGVCRTILSDPAGPASPLLAAVQHVLAGNGFRHLASVKLIACKDVVAGNNFPSRSPLAPITSIGTFFIFISGLIYVFSNRRLLPDALPPTVELLTEASLAVSSTTTYSDAFQIISGSITDCLLNFYLFLKITICWAGLGIFYIRTAQQFGTSCVGPHIYQQCAGSFCRSQIQSVRTRRRQG